MTFIWHSLIAALIPIALREVPLAIERFLLHLARAGRKARERAVDRFRRLFISGNAEDG
jgi:hypothetical protein